MTIYRLYYIDYDEITLVFCRTIIEAEEWIDEHRSEYSNPIYIRKEKIELKYMDEKEM